MFEPAHSVLRVDLDSLVDYQFKLLAHLLLLLLFDSQVQLHSWFFWLQTSVPHPSTHQSKVQVSHLPHQMHCFSSLLLEGKQWILSSPCLVSFCFCPSLPECLQPCSVLLLQNTLPIEFERFWQSAQSTLLHSRISDGVC